MEGRNFTFIDLFAGIGGFRLAMESAGGRSLGFSEINPSAIRAYCDNFGESPDNNLGDIRKLSELPSCDLLTAGVPCQSWSVAGKRLGFDDERGQLWNDTLFLLDKSRPKAFIFENVKGLTDKTNKVAFDYILGRIAGAGYHAVWKVIDASDHGVPQQRERLYVVGFREKEFADKFKWPESEEVNTMLGDFVEGCDRDSLRLIDTRLGEAVTFNDMRSGPATIHSWDLTTTTERQKHVCMLMLRNRRKKKYGLRDGNPLSLAHFQELDDTVTEDELEALVNEGIFVKEKDADGFRYALKNNRANIGINGVYRVWLPYATKFATLVASGGNDFVTPVAFDFHPINTWKERFVKEVVNSHKYRRLTASEALRIQGFPDTFRLPESGWVKLLGNSVAVPVVRKLVGSVIQTHIFK